MIGWVLSKPLGLLLGFVYPSYCSFKALETHDDIQDDQQWLTYWIVFSLFAVVEGLMDVLVSWFPFYYELKLGLVLWLQLPSTQGALVVYDKFVHPWLKQHEKSLDENLEELANKSKEASQRLAKQGLSAATELGQQALETTIDYVKNNESVRNAVGEALSSSSKPAGEQDTAELRKRAAATGKEAPVPGKED